MNFFAFLELSSCVSYSYFDEILKPFNIPFLKQIIELKNQKLSDNKKS